VPVISHFMNSPNLCWNSSFEEWEVRKDTHSKQ
jgi:hypothetical protein